MRLLRALAALLLPVLASAAPLSRLPARVAVRPVAAAALAAPALAAKPRNLDIRIVTQPWSKPRDILRGKRLDLLDLPGARNLFDGARKRADHTGLDVPAGARAVTDNYGNVWLPVENSKGSLRMHMVALGPPAPVKPVPGTEGLTGQALFNTLRGRMVAKSIDHTYQESMGELFSRASQVEINRVPGVVEGYSLVFIPGTSRNGRDYPEAGDINDDGFADEEGMNVEHLFPQSKFGRAAVARAWIHHLLATFMKPNGVRGTLPFGEVPPETVQGHYHNSAGARSNDKYFEPPDMMKGYIARRLLGFRVRFANETYEANGRRGLRTFPVLGKLAADFFNPMIPTLLRWNAAHPPSTWEAARNAGDEEYHKSGNPFVDDPSLADRVGVGPFRIVVR